MLELSTFNTKFSSLTIESTKLEAKKRKIISDITANYAARNRMDSASPESKNLYDTLTKIGPSIEDKWNAIHAYASFDGKNIGKAMYNIIKAELQEHITERSSISTSFHVIGDSMKESLSARTVGDSTVANTAGAISKGFTGMIKGLFAVTTRNENRTSAQIQAAVDYIKEFENSDESCAKFVKLIIDRYNTAKLLNISTSPETTTLLAKLNSENESPISKMKAVREYMELNDKGFYLNNGKKLFTAVYDLVQLGKIVEASASVSNR